MSPNVTPSRKETAGHRWAGRTIRSWLGSISLAELPREARRRAQVMIGSVVLATVALAAVLAVILVSSADNLITGAANRRAQHSLDLLATVGADMPDLTSRSLEHGFSAARVTALNRALRVGQLDNLIASMTIWNEGGEVIYSVDGGGASWATSPAVRSELVGVLRGHQVTVVNPSELDLTSHRRTGTLQAFEPLRDTKGRIVGAIEIDLPLKPILQETGQQRQSILVFVICALAVLWLLFLPLITQATVGIARSWTPGRRRLLGEFERALDEGAIELLYQPQIWTRNGSVHGFEALVRWRRDGKLQTPDTFLPAVESSALMTDLSDRVIELATAQLAAWRLGGYTPRVSINLSAKDLEDDRLATRITAALTRHAVPSDQLTAEVTETAILSDTACAQRVLTAISELGVQIAVDDFGTGHASISRLHQFPIDEIKIDRSFVTPTDARTRSYLKAIIRFSQSLGLRVVAEGVEEEWTLTFLRDLGCDIAQGYHIARPLPAGQIQDWLSENRPDTATGPTPAPIKA